MFMSVKFVLLACCVLYVSSDNDGANCKDCATRYRGRCNRGNSPTTCDDTRTGCYKYDWRGNKWTPYNYPPANCNECLSARKGTSCNEKTKTCTRRTGVLHWNCNKIEECSWRTARDPKACN